MSSLKAAKKIYPHLCPKCGTEYFSRGWYWIVMCENHVEIISSNKSKPVVVHGDEIIVNMKGGKHSKVYPVNGKIVIDDGSRRNKRVYHFEFSNGSLMYRWGEQL